MAKLLRRLETLKHHVRETVSMVVVPQDTRHTSGTIEEDIDLPSSNVTGDNLDTTADYLLFDFSMEELGPRNTWKLLERPLSTYPA